MLIYYLDYMIVMYNTLADIGLKHMCVFVAGTGYYNNLFSIIDKVTIHENFIFKPLQEKQSD